jgi:hypothetical protein
MNADGSPGVDTDVEVKLALPHVATVAWVLLGLGAVVVTGAVAVRSRSRMPA